MPGQKRVFALDVPGIHVLFLREVKTFMAGTSPAMTGIFYPTRHSRMPSAAVVIAPTEPTGVRSRFIRCASV